MTVVHLSSSLWSAQRHGGVRRSEQIVHDIGRVYDELPVLSCSRITRTWRVRPTVALPTAWRALCLLLQGVLSPRGFVRYLTYGTSIAQFLATHKPGLVTLELCPGVSMIAGDIVRRSGVPYVVFPQNLEFLVPSPRPEVTFRNFVGAYEIEALLYRQARKVFAISGFDATILKCMGVDAGVWSSYPPEEDVVRFAKIRDARQANAADRSEVLVLGTAINPPTHAGMSALLHAVRTSSSWTHRINVVGFGTDTLDNGGSPYINIVGPVANDALDDLMIRSAFALIYQPPTTGFLTRLVDLNLAGIPVAVIGGYQQARDLQDFGIFFFDRLEAIDPGRLLRVTSKLLEPPTLDGLRAAL